MLGEQERVCSPDYKQAAYKPAVYKRVEQAVRKLAERAEHKSALCKQAEQTVHMVVAVGSAEQVAPEVSSEFRTVDRMQPNHRFENHIWDKTYFFSF